MTTIEEFLRSVPFPRDKLECFLDPAQSNWACPDSEVGYLLVDALMPDGMDGSSSIYHYERGGPRLMMNYDERPCRINTYGDSFTQCHQVSDAETWQEILAAHFGEPIRNFGIGGHGVYQAYLRYAKTTEAYPADYVILNIWHDDHVRSIDRCRWIRTWQFAQYLSTAEQATNFFHNVPWACVRFDPETETVSELENEFPDPESLYALCDPETMVETYRDDLVAQFIVGAEFGILTDPSHMQRLADYFGVPPEFDSAEEIMRTVGRLQHLYSFKTTEYVVRKMHALAASRQAKLLVVLSYGSGPVIDACHGRERFDQAFVEFMAGSGIDVIDTLEKHVQDYQAFKISPEEYAKRYYIGHYNPAGNHFFAFSIKDELVSWLEPKPITYNQAYQSIADIAALLA